MREASRSYTTDTGCALASFIEEIRTNPEAWQGHYHAGLAYLDLSDARRAVSELQLAAGKRLGELRYQLALGIAPGSTGENGQAEMAYRAAYGLDPEVA